MRTPTESLVGSLVGSRVGSRVGRRRAGRVAGCAAAAAVATVLSLATADGAAAAHDPSAAAHQPSAAALALGRAVLPAGDGWGSAGAGTTGGSAAVDAEVSVVHDRSGLISALGGDNATNLTNTTPKIVFVKGTIDLNTDDAGHPLTCADYADPAYSLPAYLAVYDPAVWGVVAVTGPLEDARLRSAANQKARVMINVGSNTTIVGLAGGRILGGNLLLGNAGTSVSNIIVRNLTFEDAHDCFPAWTPTDGANGNWNSLYDNVTLARATNVWLDHDKFSDGNDTDDLQPLYLGRPYQVHDGTTDIIRGSDDVTVSYNVYAEHDKAILVGSTNTPGDPTTNPAADLGRLRVTFHHNRFDNLGQRSPRVRFGQVDVYDNYYRATDEGTFGYSWGVGVGSAIYAENNFFLRSADIPLDAFVHDWGGTHLTERGTLVRVGTAAVRATSLLAAYNATHTPTLDGDAGWTPTLRLSLDPTAAVPALVTASAGPGTLLH